MTALAERVLRVDDVDHTPIDVAAPQRRQRVNALLLASIAVLTIVHAINITGFPINFEDEGTYVAQAWSAWTQGELAHYTYWYDHPPIGWLLIAPWLFVTQAIDRYPSAITAGRELLVLVKVCNLLLLYALARRTGQTRSFALVTILIFGLSPLGIYWQRQVLLDNVAMPFVLAGFVMAYDHRRRLSQLTFGAVMLAIAILIKETYLLFAVGYAFVVFQRTPREIRRFAIPISITVAGLVLALYPTFALLKGELFPGPDHVSLLEALKWQLVDRAGTGSVLDPTSLTRQTYHGWYFLDPFLVVVGTVTTVIALGFRRIRGLAITTVVLSLMPLRSGYTPSMYIIAFFPLWALSISWVLERSVQALTRLRWADLDFVGRGVIWRWVRSAAAIAAIMVFVVVGVDSAQVWTRNYHRLLTSDENYATIEAARWLEDNYGARQPVLVDDTLWLELVRNLPDDTARSASEVRDQTIWYYKLDTDPTVAERFPNGWRDFGWVISSNIMRGSREQVAQTDAALDNSVTVKQFGSGEDRIEMRRVVTAERATDPTFMQQVYGQAVPRASASAVWSGRRSVADQLPSVDELMVGDGLPPTDQGVLLRLPDGEMALGDLRCKCQYRVGS